MPRGQPFTRICQHLARLRRGGVADFHLHTTASDGDCTPSQLVVLAREARLETIAITDHDTVAGVAEAQATAATLRHGPQVVLGAELTTTHDGRETHLLAYGFDPAHAVVRELLDRLRLRRVERFNIYVHHLCQLDDRLQADRAAVIRDATAAPGRRHLAQWIVACGVAPTMGLAFRDVLRPARERLVLPAAPPIADVIATVHATGGVTSLAHPHREFDDAEFDRLVAIGLDAIEATHPAIPTSRGTMLKLAAVARGKLTTGGSDFHGPGGTSRPGSVRIDDDECQSFLSRIASANRAGTLAAV